MEQKIGTITNYLANIKVAIVDVKKSISIGDKIRIRGPYNDFVQEVKDMQCNKKKIDSAKKGDLIGLKVEEKVSEGDELIIW